MLILPNSGHVALAIAVMQQPIHLAWGTGDPAWDAARVDEPVSATALVAEVGRRAVTAMLYCVPDPAGDIIVHDGRYAISATPTNQIYLRFTYDFTDSPAANIREIGVFLGATTNPALPSGQKYFAPTDVTNPGTLLLLERFQKFNRSADVRQSFEFVYTL